MVSGRTTCLGYALNEHWIRLFDFKTTRGQTWRRDSGSSAGHRMDSSLLPALWQRFGVMRIGIRDKRVEEVASLKESGKQVASQDLILQ